MSATFPVIEFRRYALVAGEQERFARCFEAWFPEAFQQLGALGLGQFRERGVADSFTWIRGFADYEARGAINQAFYSGPVWAEHRAAMNARMIDHTNVLLLRPLAPERGILVLPSVDPIAEPDGARGLAVAQLCAVAPGEVEAFAREADPVFARYREAGAREAGVLVTLDVASNNFPGLPFRTDGPYLVWLGLLPDEAALARLRPELERGLPALAATRRLRGVPELCVLEPTPRSRLRWRPDGA